MDDCCPHADRAEEAKRKACELELIVTGGRDGRAIQYSHSARIARIEQTIAFLTRVGWIVAASAVGTCASAVAILVVQVMRM